MRASDAQAVGVVDVAGAAVGVGGLDQAVGIVIAVRDADPVAGLRLGIAVVIVGVAGDRAIDRFRLQTVVADILNCGTKSGRVLTAKRSGNCLR